MSNMPSSLTFSYHHEGCCQEFAGHAVTVDVPVNPDTGSYVTPPAPRCAYNHSELALTYTVPQGTYSRR